MSLIVLSYFQFSYLSARVHSLGPNLSDLIDSLVYFFYFGPFRLGYINKFYLFLNLTTHISPPNNLGN